MADELVYIKVRGGKKRWQTFAILDNQIISEKKVVFEMTQRLEADWAKGKPLYCYPVKSSNKKSVINLAYEMVYGTLQ